MKAYKAIAVISGDERVTTYMGTEDSFTGSVCNVFLTGAARFARAIAVPAIVQGLVIAQYAHEEGLATERDAVISAVNTKLGNTVLKMIDTSAYSEVILEIFQFSFNEIHSKVALSKGSITSAFNSLLMRFSACNPEAALL